ncbi:MAG: hypothetical protein KBS38_05180, partial [Bacteroidales bacterium]|nr:hypothetical protein [Candidatus Cacconaster caballi]
LQGGEDSTPAAGKPLPGKCVRKRNFSRLEFVFRELGGKILFLRTSRFALIPPLATLAVPPLSSAGA